MSLNYNNHMPKTRSQYVCQQCGRISPRQMGRCPQCGEWNSMVEEIARSAPTTSKKHAGRIAGPRSSPQRITEIGGEINERHPISIVEFSRVLGGGIVQGSIVLIGGDPGIGKSTLLLQLGMDLAEQVPVLYVSGEESERQIKMRAQRLVGILQAEEDFREDGPASLPDDLYLVTETSLPVILEHASELKPKMIVIDSIQTTYLPELESSSGSVTQVRESASRLRELAKSSGLAVFLIGHVTKEGTIAGPRVLEHIVDTVLYLEGDRYQSYRLLRSVKNRFGATSEVGVFEMCERGMVEVSNPSEAFLAERMVDAPGSAIAVTMEGTRPLLVEIQGLTSPTSFGNPRRTANGLDFNRLLLTTAVLARRMGIRLSDQDVFVNVVGGLSVNEPAADLAVAAAIASSIRNTPLRADCVLVGEVGLSGELRAVRQTNSRLREAARLGFKSAVVPRQVRKGEPWPDNLEIKQARSLSQALKFALLEK